MLAVNTVSDLPTSAAQNELRYVQGRDVVADGGGGIFRADPADTTTADNGGTVRVRGTLRWKREWDKNYLSALWFGAKADGATDDAPAIRNMIAAAEASKVGLCVFPYGVNGTYLCNSRVVEGRQLGNGLTFVGVGNRGASHHHNNQVALRYTGSGVLWDILGNIGDAGLNGRWRWKDLTFKCMNGAGGAFRFNNPSGEMTHTSSDPSLFQQIEFESCMFWGAYEEPGVGGANQTGNGIEAMAVFELVTDDQCSFRDFKRGVFLKGGDNCRIGGRFQLNVRNIMLTRTGTYGNDTIIDARYCGVPRTDGVESAQHLHMGAAGSSVLPIGLEGNSQAMIYLNAEDITVYRPHLGPNSPSAPNNVIVHLGPNARDCAIYSPTCQAPGGTVNTYDTPASWNWRADTNHKLTVYSPSSRLEQEVFKPHPRLKVVGDFNTVEESKRVGELTASGESARRVFASAMNIEAMESAGGTFISGIGADTDAYQGYRFNLATGGARALVALKVGTDVKNGQTLRVQIRGKLAATPTSGDIGTLLLRNGGFVGWGNGSTATTYTTWSSTFTVSGASAGDTLSVGPSNGADQVAHISSILVEVLEPPSVTGSRGSNAALASLLTQLASRGIVVDNTT